MYFQFFQKSYYQIFEFILNPIPQPNSINLVNAHMEDPCLLQRPHFSLIMEVTPPPLSLMAVETFFF